MAVDVIEERSSVDGLKRWVSLTCTLCGWGGAKFRNTDTGFGMVADPPWNSVKELRAFDLSSSEIALSELASHLKRRYSDIYSLDARRFEELVADVFSEDGKDAMLTQQTRDGGVDIFLRNRTTGEIDAVIECKKYASTRKVGIAPVQRLAGVALEWQSKRAFVVTTSEFTSPAIASAKRISDSGVIGMDLVAATELLQMLGVYNDHLPPLNLITSQLREDISRSNRATTPGHEA
jgi:restriction endonuclease Mrr